MTTKADNVSHAIIAGVNKCGTTSVFRYLSDHPDVCASNVKETRFFVRYPDGSESLSYQNYLTNFQHRDQERVLLEASPTYFSSGEIVGARINEILPGSRIIVILRDPISKLFSYYRSALVYDNFQTKLLQGLSFGEFVDIALDSYRNGDVSDPRRQEFSKMLQQGRYFDHIPTFASQYPAKRLRFFFFEDLVDDPRSVMKDICRFLDLEDNFFENYVFKVENKTRTYRSIALQKLVFRANMRLEKALNRFPELRKSAQSLYRAVNESRQADVPQIDAESYDKLYRFYHDNAIELRSCLADSFGVTRFPDWITRHEETIGEGR